MRTVLFNWLIDFVVSRLGLCNDCINQITRDMPPPTPADLQGFWEMVYLQVENVDSTFADLETIRANGWKVMTAYLYMVFPLCHIANS